MLAVTDQINRKFHTSFAEVNMMDLTEFWKEVVPEEMSHWGWGPDCFNRESFLDTLEPNDGVVDAIQLLLAADCPVVVSCDRPAHQVAWVARYLAKYEVVVPVYSTQECDGGKDALVEEFSITCLIDDSPASCMKQAEKRSTSTVFLYDAPWNKTAYLPLDSKVKRLHGWADLIDRIMEEDPDELSPAD